MKNTVAKYLLSRLREFGVKHIFGVPGDYVLDFMDRIPENGISLIGTCNELNAGYAADGYARINGLGAAVVTYGVGGLSIINAIAGAYAEQVPLVVISGAPHSMRRKSNALVHHLTRDYNLQFDIFRKITTDAAVLQNPSSAPWLIDRVLRSCIINKRPVYFEIPVDSVDSPCPAIETFDLKEERHSDPESLSECIEEAVSIINSSKRPVILAGVELSRFGLAREAMKLVEKAEIPYASTINSKSVLPELHPQFIGVYMGELSREHARKQVEESDCLLSLGTWMTDMVTGGFTAKLKDENLIDINSEHVRVRHHFYQNVWIGDFIRGLTRKIEPRSFLDSHPVNPHLPSGEYIPVKGCILKLKRFYDRINRFIDDTMILIPDTGDALCASAQLYIQEADNFLCQAYYLSIGFGLPATLGVSLACDSKRAVLIIGDGAFQATCQELSTIFRNKCRPVIFLLNNKGYTIERLIHDGPYNDIQEWKYSCMPEIFSPEAVSFDVRTEDELEKALDAASSNTDVTVFVEIHLDPWDCSETLSILGEKFRKLSRK